MKSIESQCITCSIRGYSKEICKLHRQHMNKETCQHHEAAITPTSGKPQPCSWKSFGLKAAIGAGLGVTGMFAGLAVLPVFGLKAILGHSLATTLSGAGGALGAGTNVALHQRKQCSTDGKKKKKDLVLPNAWRDRND